jgi:hypothetical protein
VYIKYLNSLCRQESITRFVTRVCNNTLPGAILTYFQLGTVTKFVIYTAVVFGSDVPLIVCIQEVATGSQPCFALQVTLTPWSRVLSEKLTGPQLVKELTAFYETRRFITTFTSARHLSLS